MKRLVKLFLNSAIIGSILLSNISNVFASQVVKVSIGNTIASVNGYDTTLSVAPYIQQPSDSMMIPLRFVSTGLGINENAIQYNSNTKEITITYNGTTAKFIVGTNKLVLNGEEFSMLIENKYPVYTEIKNGSTFIPLRSLELAFGVKIDWVNETKTAILTNGKENTNIIEEVQNVEQVITTPIIENENQVNQESNKSKEFTEEEIRAMEEEVVKLVNEERAKHNLQPLEIDEILMKLSREKSEDMYTNNYFSHISEKLGAPADVIRSNGLEFTWMGENIAKGQTTPSEVVQGWMNSKGHRENILSPNAKYIGVGYFGGIQDIQVNSYKGSEIKKDYVPYWTQQFIG